MADGIAGNVAVATLEPIRDRFYAVISRHYGYMIHCEKNIQDFADEVDNLKNAQTRVQIEVDAARANAEDIHDDVLKWLGDVQSSLPTLEQDKIRLLQGKDNLKCLDVCSPYRLGKEGKKKTPDVTKLIEAGKFDAVGHRPLLKCTWHKTDSINYESFESRELVFKEIMEALKDDTNYKIGIYGMAGVGKTRMMKEVAQQAEKEELFDEIAKIVFTQNPNVKEMQQQLAEDLNLSLDKETEEARKELLLKRLKNGKKILIMVDDIWDSEIKLEKIGIPDADNNSKGCKIIMTSRIKDACVGMGVKKPIEIGVLSEFEAFDLFKKTVGESIELLQLHSIAGKVCNKCDGLPLAIVTIGAALRNEEARQVWDDTLYQLENSKGYNVAGVDEKLYSCIELSYKYLKQKNSRQKELQSCFLLCCLFPEDAEISIDDLARYGVGTRSLEGPNRESMKKARDRTCKLVDTLKKCNLLLNGRNQNFVKMHDVIRDVAISIASEEKDVMFLVKAGVRKWPVEDEYKQCKTISLRFNDDCVLPDDSNCTEVCTLMLEFPKISSEVPSSFFKGMEKLKVLQLHNMQISKLPASLKNLRMLWLYNCRLVNIAFLKEFKKLEILCIEDSNLKELAPEIGQLTRLQLLDLRGCYWLQIIPSGVISSLTQLEDLYIPDEFDQWEVEGNASLMELDSLTCLISLQIHVPNVELLPLKEIPFKLIRFQISIGSQLNYSDFFLFTSTQATRILKLVGFPMKKELNILMEKAEVLYLGDLKENIPKGLCGSVSFSELSLLKIVNCKSMIHLFSSVTAARSLSQLQELSISDCKIMEEIVRDDQEVMDGVIIFQHLKKIWLEDLPKFKSFYANMKKMTTRECNTSTIVQALFNDKVRFPALEELKIGKLQSLIVIWDKQLFLGSEAQNSFRQLRFVTVHECDKLVNVIPTYAFPMLHNLESLKVVSCDSMVYGAEVAAIEEGSNEILMFPQLKKLELEKLPNLKSFCYSNIGGSKEEEGGGKTLVFPQLNTITLGELPKLSGICCSRRGGEESVLKESHISQQQADLFNYKVEFPILEKLVLGDGSIFGGIWKNCNKVRFMEVKKYINVVNACTLLQWLSLEVVEELSLKSCDSMEVIFNLEGLGAIERKAIVSSQAKTLRLWDLPKLERIWIMESQGLLVFHNLTSLSVYKCNSMRYVFSLSIARGLTQLRMLYIRECSVMEEIVRSEGQGEEDDMEEIVFSQLEELWLRELPNLTCFCGTNNAFYFPSLKEVWLHQCPKLQTFTSGGISTSGGITLRIHGQTQRGVSDLNSYVQKL